MRASDRDHHHHSPTPIRHLLEHLDDKLSLVLSHLESLTRRSRAMSKELDDLTAEVSRSKTVDDSVLALLAGILAKLEAAGTDPAAIAALTQELRANTDTLAAAVTANTPADA